MHAGRLQHSSKALANRKFRERARPGGSAGEAPNRFASSRPAMMAIAGLPLGSILYWFSNAVWTFFQQRIIFRRTQSVPAQLEKARVDDLFHVPPQIGVAEPTGRRFIGSIAFPGILDGRHLEERLARQQLIGLNRSSHHRRYTSAR